MAAAVQALSSSSSGPPGVGQCLYGIATNSGAFKHCMDYLTIKDFSNFCEVSKIWKAFIDGPSGQLLWKNLSIREGVPVVEGNDRNYKDEFRFLRHITIGGKTIARYLGEIVGEVPRMRQDRFFELGYSLDIFARSKREFLVVLVDPAALKITVSPDRPLTLDESGTLVEVPDAKRAQIAPRELIVPLSLKNLRMLATHPLAGMENGPVFNPDPVISIAEVFNQCNVSSDQNRILIMREEVIARNTPFNGDHGQNAQVINRGWEVMTVRQRGLYDTIKILKTGTCPDNRVLSGGLWTYARSAERVELLGFGYFNAGIGAFTRGIGLNVYASGDLAAEDTGVVPVVSAEVLRPQELG